MIVSIHQLHYLPWLRYIHKIACSDIFVILDNIQFNKNGWQNRNKIKTPQGPAILTVPVLHKMAQNLDQVLIDNKQNWRRKHWGTIENHYRKAPYFQEHEPFFRNIYESDWEKLNDINYSMLMYFIKALGIKTRIVRGSEVSAPGEATERLVNICKQFKATAYLTGAFAAGAYLDANLFQTAGIRLETQEFHCPQYPQLYPEAGFVPELSVMDLLFNCGASSLEVLLSNSDCKTSGESRP